MSEFPSENLILYLTSPSSPAPASFLTNQGISSLIGAWNPSGLSITYVKRWVGADLGGDLLFVGLVFEISVSSALLCSSSLSLSPTLES